MLALTNSKADDTRGNFFYQRCLGTFPLGMGNKFLFGYFHSLAGSVFHLVDGNMLKKLPSVSSGKHTG